MEHGRLQVLVMIALSMMRMMIFPGDEDIFKVLDAALKAGYRHIDTAVAYNNHQYRNVR